MRYFVYAALMALVCSPVMAQERTAAGPVDTQMTWSALTAQITTISTKTDAVNTRVDQVVICGKKGLVYAPGKAGADAQGCADITLPTSVLTQINNLQTSVNNLTTTTTNLTNTTNHSISCGASGQLYNGTTCVAGGGSLKISKVTMYGSGAYSSNKIVDSGWHSFCTLAFNHNDSNFWLSMIAGPNADGKARWRASRGAGGAEPMLLCID